MPDETPTDLDYDAFWGDLAKPGQVKVAARGIILLSARTLRGPVMRLVEASRGTATPEDVKAFCEDALLAWYEKYRDRKAAAGPERLTEITALLPTPGQGEAMHRIDVNLEGRIREEAFGRVLEARFKATPQGRSMAIREAILEALLAVKDR